MDEAKKLLNEFEARIRENKLRRYRGMNRYAKKGETVMVGSSLMEHFMINEFLLAEGMDKVVYNRGVAGWRTDELLKNMDACIFDLEPRKIFINIGSNDLDRPGDALGRLVKQFRKILRRIKERLPGCTVCVMAYYPVLRDFDPGESPANSKARTREGIEEANRAIEALAAEMGCEFLDLNHVLKDEDGYLKPEFGADKVHLLPPAYKAVFDEIKRYL